MKVQREEKELEYAFCLQVWLFSFDLKEESTTSSGVSVLIEYARDSFSCCSVSPIHS